MNVNLYLPDELGQQAKQAELPLSQLLREAVTAELERRQAVAKAINEASEHLLDLCDDSNGGRGEYVGRLVGIVVGWNGYGDTIYLADDGRVIAHRDTLNHKDITVLDDPAEDLRQYRLDDYDATMQALGLVGVKEIIDI
jgi:hypothetical protein